MKTNPIPPAHNHDELYVKHGEGVGITRHGDLEGLNANDHPQYLLTTGKATDSDKLDGIDSTGFVKRDGNEDISGKKTFNSFPNLPVITNPTLPDEAVNKKYADEQLATKVGKTGNESVGGVKTFTSIPVLPGSNPTQDNQAARKKWIDDLDALNVKLAGTQTITGAKTFNALPLSSVTPTVDNHLTRKGYVDLQLATKVGKTGDESVDGVKTFTSIPVLPGSNPTQDNQATRKKWVDDQLAAKVSIAYEQTITGKKYFSLVPRSNEAPTANTDLTRKSYVDNAVDGANDYAIGLFNDLQAQLNNLKGLFIPIGPLMAIDTSMTIGSTNYYASSFGVPASASAISVYMYVTWDANGWQSVQAGEYGISGYAIACRPSNHVDGSNTWSSDVAGIIPLGSSSRFWINRTTLAPSRVHMRILGYFT